MAAPRDEMHKTLPEMQKNVGGRSRHERSLG
jgi:hypothetical protein